VDRTSAADEGLDVGRHVATPVTQPSAMPSALIPFPLVAADLHDARGSAGSPTFGLATGRHDT